MLSVDAIATDNTVNIAEKTAGFAISGATGSEAGVAVSVTIGSQSPLTATSDSNGAWSVRRAGQRHLHHRHQRGGVGRARARPDSPRRTP